MARKLIVEIVGDSKSYERALQRSGKATKEFQLSVAGIGRSAAGVFGGIAAAFGTREVAQGLGGAVQAASDLEEQTNRVNVVFAESADSIRAWSETTAKAIGIASRESLAAASNFGTMLQTAGIAERQAASMSRALVELGADMASFNNQDPSEMLDRLRSGLAGEAEPLRRFGILLSEARVQQEAYRSGIAKTGAKLTEQQKVLGRYQLILKDTVKQQGDFARTSDSLANQMRVLNAEWDEAQATLGRALIPAITWLLEGFNDWTREVKIVGQTTAKVFVGMGENAVKAVRAIVKPFTYLPDWLGGGWADDVEAKLDEWARDLDGIGRRIGDDFAASFGLGFTEGLKEHLSLKNRPELTPTPTEQKERFKATAEQRNQWFDAKIARQLNRLQDLSLRKQLEGLRTIAQTIRARLAATKDATRRLNLEDQLLEVYRMQKSVQEQITAKIKEGNELLKDRANAIKSALIERLQRRQTDILNRRALQDARETLRIARQIGGPKGIQQALRDMQDVQFDIQRARLEAAPATLTAGGRFALGNIVTINVNGVTDPDAVARRVAEVIQRKSKKTTKQRRGPRSQAA